MDNDKDQLPSSTLDRILVSSVSYVLVLAGFLLITGAVFFYELFEARQYLTTQFQADALRRTETVQGLLNYPLTHMNTIRMFFSSSEEVTSQEFGQFCREWIDQGIFLLIGWIPPANVREAGGGYVLSSELRTSEIGSLPWNDNELDTIMSKENSLTENRILIDSERPGQILALMPVSATKGILYARFDPDSLLSPFYSEITHIGLSFQIVEETESEERVLYRYKDQSDTGGDRGKLFFSSDNLRKSTPFAFADKEWRIDIKADPLYLRETASNMPLYILISGIILSALLTFFLYQRSVGKLAFLEKANELDRFFTLTLDLFCITDLNGTLIRINPQWERTLGYPEGTLKGSSFLDLVHPEDIDSTLEAVEQLTHGKEVRDFTNRYRCADNSYRWIEWRSIASDNLIYAAARDITERKEWEQKLIDSLQEKEILMREIHHRVKNSLQIVKSMLNLEKGRSSDPFFQDVLERNQNRINAIALVHEILYTSDSMITIDFSRHIRELISLYSQTKDGRIIDYSLDIREVLLPLDIAMPCGLIVNEILTNSIQHALDQTREPGISLVFFHDRQSAEGCIEISDNGPGFTMPDPGEKPSGLGLQMILALTEQIHGHLDFSGSGGAHFHIRFPIPET